MSIQGRGVRRSHESPREENAMRFLTYTLADPTIPMPPPTPELYAQMDAFVTEATKAGVLVATGGLAPPEQATRVRRANGQTTVLDGPFTEAKELVGGWALMECRDEAEVIEWTRRFLDIVGEGETTIRQVFGP
jgi:hypothetical protein